MFGAIIGYALCGFSVLTALYEVINGGSVYEKLPKEKQTPKFLFLCIGVPLIINVLYTILAFMMMIKIPSFTWWMCLIFTAVSCCFFSFGKSHFSHGLEIGAFILLFVNIPDSVKGTALICLITDEVLKWIVNKMMKENAKAANEEESPSENKKEN